MDGKEFERNEPIRKSVRIKTKRMISTETKSLIDETIMTKNKKNELNQVGLTTDYFMKLSDLDVVPKKSDKPIDNEQNEDDATSLLLESLSKQIHNMEFDSILKKNTEEAVEPSMIDKKINRYAELGCLLNTGISDIASGTGLCYLERNPNETDEEIGSPIFKRGDDSRNSTSCAIGHEKYASIKPRPNRPASRTASDSKNIETVRQMRQNLIKPSITRPIIKAETLKTPEIAKQAINSTKPQVNMTCERFCSNCKI